MPLEIIDAFDLPEWFGTSKVSWHSTSPLRAGPHVTGELDGGPGEAQRLDLLAVDAAYPAPVCPDAERRAAHQAWQYGEVALLDMDGTVCAGVPGRQFDANLAYEALRRLAKAVAANPGSFTVSLTL